jgi:phosphate transport system substrate-binding protein
MTLTYRLLTFASAATVAAEPLAAQTQVTGAGATFPYPVYSKWFDAYHKRHADVQINYQSIGSGGGIRQVTEATVDFGATDGPMTEEQLAAFKAKRGRDIIHFPTVLGAVVPIYNVPGLTAQLKFTPEALAGIFLGTITKWNDPAIASANPGARLPATTIVVVRLPVQGQHRVEGEGRREHLGELAGRDRRKGQRGRVRPGQADRRRHRLR